MNIRMKNREGSNLAIERKVCTRFCRIAVRANDNIAGSRHDIYYTAMIYDENLAICLFSCPSLGSEREQRVSAMCNEEFQLFQWLK